MTHPHDLPSAKEIADKVVKELKSATPITNSTEFIELQKQFTELQKQFDELQKRYNTQEKRLDEETAKKDQELGKRITSMVNACPWNLDILTKHEPPTSLVFSST